MRKIDLTKIEEFKTFARVPAGGYIAVILGVKDVPFDEKTQRGDYLEVSYDIAEGEYKAFYTKRKKENGWELPNFRVYYSEKSLPFYKGFVTALQKSNPKYKYSDNEQNMVRCLIGIVLGDEEYQNQKGQVRVRTNVVERHSVDIIKKGEFEVPEIKKLEISNKSSTSNSNPFAKKENNVEADDFDFFGGDSDEEDTPFPSGEEDLF